MRHARRTWKVEWLATGIFVVVAVASPGASSSIGLGRLHLARVAIDAVDAAAQLPDAAASALGVSADVSPVVQHVIVPANSSTDPPPVRFPPWWSGLCDDNYYAGSFPLSSWDGLTACGPGPNRGGYDRRRSSSSHGAWGELRVGVRRTLDAVALPRVWRAALSCQRFGGGCGRTRLQMAAIWRRSPTTASSVPRPGDVLSHGIGVVRGPHGGRHRPRASGHGYGTINILEQNMNGGNGTNTLDVIDDVVQPDYGMPVTGWLRAGVPADRGCRH